MSVWYVLNWKGENDCFRQHNQNTDISGPLHWTFYLKKVWIAQLLKSKFCAHLWKSAKGTCSLSKTQHLSLRAGENNFRISICVIYMRFSELATAMRCVGDIDPPNLTFCFNLNQIPPLIISVAFRGVRTAHCHKSLLTTTMSKSSLVLPRKYCIIFGFFPLFLLHCLNDHLYRCFIMMTTKTSPPLKQPQCHHSEVQEWRWRSPILAQLRGSKTCQAAWREGCQNELLQSTPNRCPVLILVRCTNKRQFLFSHQALPVKLKMQKWYQEKHFGQMQGRVKELGREAGPLSVPPTPQAALEKALQRPVHKPHIRSISTQVTSWMFIPFSSDVRS